ncbi:MAG: virulence factor [Legionella sp. 40-6]|nr:virulence factor [Legionella sp.]OJX93300.1 MAG: virulence factor [Legionella sp. 40-6]
MAGSEDKEFTELPEDVEGGMDIRRLEMEEDLNDPVALVERVYQIWWHWADFHLYIISPTIPSINPPIVLKPEFIPGTQETEYVYDIHDSGSKLSTSKGEELISAGMSMHRLYMTIEKMISLLVERLKTGGIDMETEVQVAFGGHLLPQRKAFESIINLSYNVVVTNFDPGAWGERYLQIVKHNAERFGYPPEAPRDTYRHPHQSPSAKVK